MKNFINPLINALIVLIGGFSLVAVFLGIAYFNRMILHLPNTLCSTLDAITGFIIWVLILLLIRVVNKDEF